MSYNVDPTHMTTFWKWLWAMQIPKKVILFRLLLVHCAVHVSVWIYCQDVDKMWDFCGLEMESLEKNDTWDLVQLPKGQKTLPWKWVYRMKIISDSSPKYKARLVAKGYK